MLLTLEKRFSQYEAMGEPFREERESLLVLTLGKRILLMIENLLIALAEYLVIDVCETMDRIVNGHAEVGKMMSPVKSLSPLCGK